MLVDGHDDTTSPEYAYVWPLMVVDSEQVVPLTITIFFDSFSQMHVTPPPSSTFRQHTWPLPLGGLNAEQPAAETIAKDRTAIVERIVIKTGTSAWAKAPLPQAA